MFKDYPLSVGKSDNLVLLCHSWGQFGRDLLDVPVRRLRTSPHLTSSPPSPPYAILQDCLYLMMMLIFIAWWTPTTIAIQCALSMPLIASCALDLVVEIHCLQRLHVGVGFELLLADLLGW